MNELHDRINEVINTSAFERSLKESGIDLFEFQENWCASAHGEFEKLPEAYQKAIIAGENELKSGGELIIAN